MRHYLKGEKTEFLDLLVRIWNSCGREVNIVWIDKVFDPLHFADTVIRRPDNRAVRNKLFESHRFAAEHDLIRQRIAIGL